MALLHAGIVVYIGSKAKELFDAGIVVYIALIVLGVWRLVCYWRCTGKWFQYCNYCFILMLTVLVVLSYEIYMFFIATISADGKSAWHLLPSWVQRHDRAVQIVMLPAVYGTMAMSSLARCYTALCKPGTDKAREEQALIRSETMFMVGDLYEAWALYQFGILTMELLESAISKQVLSPKDDERAAARALMVAHAAVERLAWVGILCFVLVAFVQAGYAVFLLTLGGADYTNFDDALSQFTAAGFLASGAALYQLMIVEGTFHHYLESYAPFLKFLTVKIMVTFAFFQKGAFQVVAFLKGLMPDLVQDLADKIPILGTLVNFEKIQFEVFYASLILVESVLVALLISWAWSAQEAWYDEYIDLDQRQLERDSEAILAGESPSRKNYGTYYGASSA